MSAIEQRHCKRQLRLKHKELVTHGKPQKLTGLPVLCKKIHRAKRMEWVCMQEVHLLHTRPTGPFVQSALVKDTFVKDNRIIY